MVARDIPPEHRSALRQWLFASIIAVFLTVIVGGITRLTESGLSITEWKPVSGMFPPLSAAHWESAYQEFLRIPQAQTTHSGITLSGFKFIYWWEWIHRFLARGVGLVFAIPYVWLLVRGRIPRGLKLRLSALPVLTLAQGALGWYMVQSGLAVRVSVSSYRLTAHLALALGILAVAVWTYSELSHHDERAPRASRSWRRALAAMTAMITVTVLSGGFVAGLRAGKIYNTFPLMGGKVVPPGYAEMAPWWVNAFENPIAAQFHHRVLAVLTGALALLLASLAFRSGMDERGIRAVRTLGAVVMLQVALGIATLLMSVPIALGVLHQFTGVLALTAALVASERARG